MVKVKKGIKSPQALRILMGANHFLKGCFAVSILSLFFSELYTFGLH